MRLGKYWHYQGLPDIDYPCHDKTIVVTRCGRICLGRKKINFSTVFAGQAVGIKEVHDDIWLVRVPRHTPHRFRYRKFSTRMTSLVSASSCV